MRIGRGTGGLLCYGKGLGGSASSNPNSFILARIVRGDRHRKSATSSTDWRSLMHQMRSRAYHSRSRAAWSTKAVFSSCSCTQNRSVSALFPHISKHPSCRGHRMAADRWANKKCRASPPLCRAWNGRLHQEQDAGAMLMMGLAPATLSQVCAPFRAEPVTTL